MTIDEFVTSKQITIKQLEENFVKFKEYEVGGEGVFIKIDKCLNCGDKLNNERLASESWTAVQYCWKCDTLNLVIFGDRMGGGYWDTVKCYKMA